MSGKPFHVVIWGASGFTGRLVAEHCARDYKGQVKWALAGRNLEKLETVRAELARRYGDEVDDTPILVGSLDDQASMDRIAGQTAVIINTAGTPFAKNGTPVVEAAVRNKADYVDITGEVPWVRKIIQAFHEEATAKGVRIVNCCGYDSMPFDLGALLVTKFMQDTLGVKPTSITTAVCKGKGGVSGGTLATAMYQVTQKESSGEEASGTYALIPEGASKGTDTDVWGTKFCPPLDTYLAPFIMQLCNTRVVHRSNYLLGWGGPELHYSEGVAAPGWVTAKGIAFATIMMGLSMSQTWLHPVLRRMMPAPGEGPTREDMMSGFYTHKTVGVAPSGETVVADVGDPARDPGYWGTSRMVLEAALCLALEKEQLNADAEVLKGGVLTPASAMGMHLVERLRKAGLQLDVKSGETVAVTN